MALFSFMLPIIDSSARRARSDAPYLSPRNRLEQRALEMSRQNEFFLEANASVQHIHDCQGPWNVDLRTPPGPEGSNGSLLDICRGHPGTFFNDEGRMKKAEFPAEQGEKSSFL